MRSAWWRSAPSTFGGGVFSSQVPLTRCPCSSRLRASRGPMKPPIPVMRTCIRSGCVAAAQGMTPVVQQVAQRLVERDARLPAGVSLELGGVADQDFDVRRAEPLGIDLDLDLDAGERDQPIE